MIGSPATGAQACAYGTNALRSFAQPSGLRTALTITIDWGLIAAAVLAAESSRSWWIYGLSVLVISRQFNALFELHHHAIHGNLFRIRHRNERFDWLYSVPLLIRVSEDRHEHMEHHRTFVIDEESMDVARGFADAIRQMVVLCGGREETRPGTRPITRDKKSPVVREIGRQMP
jgi:fatty acid desaturase